MSYVRNNRITFLLVRNSCLDIFIYLPQSISPLTGGIHNVIQNIVNTSCDWRFDAQYFLKLINKNTITIICYKYKHFLQKLIVFWRIYHRHSIFRKIEISPILFNQIVQINIILLKLY
jgi:hypothetical protein